MSDGEKRPAGKTIGQWAIMIQQLRRIVQHINGFYQHNIYCIDKMSIHDMYRKNIVANLKTKKCTFC